MVVGETAYEHSRVRLSMRSHSMLTNKLPSRLSNLTAATRASPREYLPPPSLHYRILPSYFCFIFAELSAAPSGYDPEELERASDVLFASRGAPSNHQPLPLERCLRSRHNNGNACNQLGRIALAVRTRPGTFPPKMGLILATKRNS